jgi:methanogenic corrinoid protein MtbC1
VIRVWEKRYEAVSPNRTDTNRRKYSEAEIERLALLRAATLAGCSIGNIAGLPDEQLRELIGRATTPPASPKPHSTGVESLIEEAIHGTLHHDSGAIEGVLSRAAVQLGQHALLERLIGPLAQRIGELWESGELSAAHEHFTSAIIRNFLIRNSKPYALNGNTPTIVVATPAGQLHELGAVMAAAAANDMGWRVIYLGTSLPALEIAGAVLRNQARALALSIVFPGDDPKLPAELEILQKNVAARVKLISGGRAAGAYSEALERCGFALNKSMSDFYATLAELRNSGPEA